MLNRKEFHCSNTGMSYTEGQTICSMCEGARDPQEMGKFNTCHSCHAEIEAESAPIDWSTIE
jgi:hypothetical protein